MRTKRGVSTKYLAAERINNHTDDIYRHLDRNTCVVVCEDHPIHRTCIEDDPDVALIVLDL